MKGSVSSECTRRDLLKASPAGLALLSGCFSSGEPTPPSETDTSPEKADCSDATITSVDLEAITSGDTIIVSGEVFRTPAPQLEGFVIRRSGERENIAKSLSSTGNFEYRFSYSHHGIRDYAFWLDGCDPVPTTEPPSPSGTDQSSQSNVTS